MLLRLYSATLPQGVTHYPNAEAEADLYYTSSESISAGRWAIVAFAPISDAEKLMSRRIVGGDIWVADESFGEASEHDLKTLPKMSIYGYRLIEKAVARLA